MDTGGTIAKESAALVEAGAPRHRGVPSSVATRVCLVFLGMLQITLAAGLIVGWAGIAGSMLVMPRDEGGAEMTLDETMQMYGLAASVNYISPLCLGILLDNFGPRTCSTVSNSLVALGCLIFAGSQRHGMFCLGISLVAFGGPGVQTSLMHLGNLFPQRRFFVMGCVAESITLSFAVFPTLDVIFEMTLLGFRELFNGLGVAVAASAVCSFFLWPDAPYEIKTEDPEEEDKASSSLLLPEDAETSAGKDQYKPLLQKSFRGQLTSGFFVRLSIFFLITSFWANFYIAIVTTELGDQRRFDLEEQHQLARQLSFIDAAAIVCAPLSGFLLDSVGFVPTAVITTALGVTQMLLLLVADSHASVMVASFVSYAVFRAFLFPYFFASLSKKLGFRFFGVLSGVAFGVSGLSQLSIAPLAAAVEGTCHEHLMMGDEGTLFCSEGKWNEIHVFQIISLLALGIIPAMDSRSSVASGNNQRQLEREPLLLLSQQSSTYYGSNEDDDTDAENGEGAELMVALETD